MTVLVRNKKNPPVGTHAFCEQCPKCLGFGDIQYTETLSPDVRDASGNVVEQGVKRVVNLGECRSCKGVGWFTSQPLWQAAVQERRDAKTRYGERERAAGRDPFRAEPIQPRPEVTSTGATESIL